MKTLYSILSGIAISTALVQGQATLAVGNVPGYPAETAMVPISARRATNAVAAQFDLAYNTTKGDLREPRLIARHTNHVVRSREIAPGVRRVLVYSRSNGLLQTNGFGGSFPFDVVTGERANTGPISPRNVMLARADGSAIAPVTAIPGTVFVAPVFRDPASGIVDLFLPSEAEQTYFIQATEDFSRWVTIATNLASGEFMDSVDLGATNYSHRFYRSLLR